MDVADIANNVADIALADALRHRAQLASRAQPGAENFDGFNCVECSEPLHAVRLTAGRARCVYCQTRLESQR